MAQFKYKVGDKYFYAPNQNTTCTARYVTVTKVGRKWVELAGGHGWMLRVKADNVDVDGGGYSSPGRLYRNEEEYNQAVKRDRLWRTFKLGIERVWNAPNHLSTEDLEKLLQQFHVTIPEGTNS